MKINIAKLKSDLGSRERPSHRLCSGIPFDGRTQQGRVKPVLKNS